MDKKGQKIRTKIILAGILLGLTAGVVLALTIRRPQAIERVVEAGVYQDGRLVERTTVAIKGE